MNILRGEIWYAELSPTQGSEQSGIRPVLVVQNDSVNKYTSTILIIPLTTNMRRASLPTCLKLSIGEGGVSAESVLLCHQMRAIDRTRLKNKLGIVSKQTLISVEDCLLFTLGIRI